jgi:hypothetical protein
MTRLPLILCLCCGVLARAADQAPPPASAALAAPDRAAEGADAAPSGRPRAVPVGTAHAPTGDEATPSVSGTSSTPAAPNRSDTVAAAKYSATDRWLLAGYNNNEIVYTIIVSNEDTRVIHCTALMQGWYLENGKRLPISDRQSVTVFPNEPAQVGNWMDMDQQSGATYTVKCRPI